MRGAFNVLYPPHTGDETSARDYTTTTIAFVSLVYISITVSPFLLFLSVPPSKPPRSLSLCPRLLPQDPFLCAQIMVRLGFTNNNNNNMSAKEQQLRNEKLNNNKSRSTNQ